LNRYTEWLETVESTPDLNGGGPLLAPIFAKVLSGRKFDTAFEWCAGPAWIGMWLLENNICKTLVTGDINKKTIDFVQKTTKKHGYDVRSYISDNLKQIPKSEKFDLVISNPPNYCDIQRSHQDGYLRDDLRPSDIDWKIHKDFYNNIGEYLNEDGEMFISEIEPYAKNFYIGGELYDKRPEIPMKDFEAMVKSNNLKITKKIPYDWDGINCYILKIEQI
jgi:methylase of polypeptide subunit release factors